MGLLEKIFGDINTKEVKKLSAMADQVLALEDKMADSANISKKLFIPSRKHV